MTPENAAMLAGYAAHLERSPMSGHSPRTYRGAIHAYLPAWLQRAGRRRPAERRRGEGLAVRDYRKSDHVSGDTLT